MRHNIPTSIDKLCSLLDRRDKLLAAAMMMMMIVGAALEMVAVGFLFPLIQMLTEPQLAMESFVARAVRNFFSLGSHVELTLALLIILTIFYIAKNSYLAVLTYVQNRYGFLVQAKVSLRLFQRYLDLPYLFHTGRNTAENMRSITSDTNQLAWSAIFPSLTIITELLVAIGLIFLLFLTSFQAAIIIGSIFLIFGFVYHRLFRNALTRWGHFRIKYETGRILAISEAFGALKELKVLGREKFFLDQVMSNDIQRTKISSRHNLVQNSSLLMLEVLGMASLLILVGILIAQGTPFSTVLPMMGIFAGAAFRLIPAFNRIITNTQSLRHCGPAIDNLYRELSRPVPPRPESGRCCEFRRELLMNKVSFAYPNQTAPVVSNLTLKVTHGETLGLIGPSGSGKTTLIDLLLGVLHPASGQITADGIDIHESIRAWQSQIGYVTQSTFIVDGTIRDNVAFAVPKSDVDDNSVCHALRLAQLDGYVAGLPRGIDSPTGEAGKLLSGGQRQRIGIARALYHNPSLLVLDEATASLDPETEKSVLDTIARLHDQVTIIFVTHRESVLAYCDRIMRLDHGALTEHPKRAVDVEGK